MRFFIVEGNECFNGLWVNGELVVGCWLLVVWLWVMGYGLMVNWLLVVGCLVMGYGLWVIG